MNTPNVPQIREPKQQRFVLRSLPPIAGPIERLLYKRLQQLACGGRVEIDIDKIRLRPATVHYAIALLKRSGALEAA